MKKRVGIIGGGAAGLFAACQLKRLKEDSDVEVTLIDRNPVPGKKGSAACREPETLVN